MGYSKAPEQLKSSARPICHSHTMTSMGREPATMHIATYTKELAALLATHCATRDDIEIYCHDLEVMSSYPGLVKLGVHGTSLLSHT